MTCKFAEIFEFEIDSALTMTLLSQKKSTLGNPHN
jgi:hypothetical protein